MGDIYKTKQETQVDIVDDSDKKEPDARTLNDTPNGHEEAVKSKIEEKSHLNTAEEATASKNNLTNSTMNANENTAENQVFIQNATYYDNKLFRSTVLKVEKVQNKFEFDIDANGQTFGLSNVTQNSFREWFYDCARQESLISAEYLPETFVVVINDDRIRQAQAELDAINKKLKTSQPLDTQEEHRYFACKKTVNHIGKENKIKAAAIKFYLSDRCGHIMCNTLEHFQCIDIINAILTLPVFNQYELDNNQEYALLDVYLNLSGYNKNHEQFIVHMRESDVVECFGESNIFDVYGRSVSEMGEYRKLIAPYYYQHLGKLQVMDNYDFTQDKRVLNLHNYYVELH